MAGWLRGHGGSGDIRMLVDRGDRVARLFGIRGVPQTFVVGRDGRMARKMVGHLRDWRRSWTRWSGRVPDPPRAPCPARGRSVASAAVRPPGRWRPVPHRTPWSQR